MPEPLQLDRAFGRQAFGADAANYDAARPPYPDWVFEDTARRLQRGRRDPRVRDRAGREPLLAIEPDPRLATICAAPSPTPALSVTTQTFEDVDLPAGGFDLGLSATAFHWLHEGPALAKIAVSLKAGGWWVALWNNFGDDAYPDLFHLATQGVLAGPASPGEGQRGEPFRLDAAARIAGIDATGAFERVLYYTSHWPLVLTADQTRSALCHLF